METYDANATHVSDERLDRYAIAGRLPEPELATLEEALATVPRLPGPVSLASLDSWRAALAGAVADGTTTEIPFWEMHVTTDGPTRVWVAKADSRWSACIRGPQLDHRSLTSSATVAVRQVKRTFARLYPEHRCRGSCTAPAARARGRHAAGG